jgi:hypothetical protein
VRAMAAVSITMGKCIARIVIGILVLDYVQTIYEILRRLLVMNKKKGAKVMGCSGYEKEVCIYKHKLSGRRL